MNNVTLRDIAKALNLSVSTISRALTDSYQIGEETKKIVLAYAKAHHYVPNRIARSLKQGKSKSIGVLVCAINNNFVSQMLDGIDQYCTANGYQIIIMQSKEDFEQEKACIELLYAGGIDGLLISPTYQTTTFDHLTNLQEAGIPVVLFDRLSDKIDTHKVAADNFAGAYNATSHLIKNGFKRIAIINSNSKLNIAIDRFKGYQKALAAANMTYHEELVYHCDTVNSKNLQQDIKLAITTLLQNKPAPDAIFTTTDQLTTNALAVLNELQINIPNDIALIGFSNTDLAASLNPPLSTIQQPAFEIGKLAAEKLLSLIKHQNHDFETTLLPTNLTPRNSSFKNQ